MHECICLCMYMDVIYMRSLAHGNTRATHHYNHTFYRNSKWVWVCVYINPLRFFVVVDWYLHVQRAYTVYYVNERWWYWIMMMTMMMQKTNDDAVHTAYTLHIHCINRVVHLIGTMNVLKKLEKTKWTLENAKPLLSLSLSLNEIIIIYIYRRRMKNKLWSP